MDIKQKPDDRPDFEDSEYIRDQLEWQEHQYNPYYFTGGKMFPFLKNPAKPFWVGLVLLLAGLAALTGVVIMLAGSVLDSGQADLDVIYFMPDILTAIFGIVLIMAAIGMFKRARKQKHH